MIKETAVEWLHYHLLHLMQTREWRSKDLHIAKFDELFVEALAMEREQMQINLPSDEEIETFALSVAPEPQKNHGTWIAYKATIAGAKWMKDKIKGGEQ
jgi:hypothetical protein